MEQAVTDRCRDRGLDCLLIPHLYHVSDSSPLWQKLAECANRAVLLCWLHPRPAAVALAATSGGRRGAHDPQSERLPGRRIGCRCGDRGRAGQAASHDGNRATSRDRIRHRAPANSSRNRRGRDGIRSSTVPAASIASTVCNSACLACMSWTPEGKVAVCNPDQCKPGCPACARICPESAIMFPLYRKDAAIAGAPGRFVTLDAAARKMFYARTRQPCPVCGQDGRLEAAAAAAGGSRARSAAALSPSQTPAAGAAPVGRSAAVRRSGRPGRSTGPTDATETLIAYERWIPDRLDGRPNLDRRLSSVVRRDVGGQPNDDRAAGGLRPAPDAAEQPAGVRAAVAPLGLRRIEAALLAGGFTPDEVAVVTEDQLDQAIGSATRVIGISSGEPAGLGMNSSTMTAIAGGRIYPQAMFRRLDAQDPSSQPRTYRRRSSWAGRAPGKLRAIRPLARNWASTTSSPATPTRMRPPRSAA